MEAKDIACIILAAGAGKRFGLPKWKAEFHGECFLEIIINKLRKANITDIGCVIRKDSIPSFSGIKYAINPSPEEGMFSSIYYGVNLFAQKTGFMVLPVDHPFVEINTLNKLLTIFTENSSCVIKPLFNNRGGHPVVLPQKFALSTPKGDFYGGLKMFIKKSNYNVLNIDVDDCGVLKNINYREDIYKNKHKKRVNY